MVNAELAYACLHEIAGQVVMIGVSNGIITVVCT